MDTLKSVMYTPETWIYVRGFLLLAVVLLACLQLKARRRQANREKATTLKKITEFGDMLIAVCNRMSKLEAKIGKDAMDRLSGKEPKTVIPMHRKDKKK
jgi:hypothetical protein